MLRHVFLKISIMFLCISSVFCLDIFLKSTSPSSLCKPVDCLSSIFDNKDSIWMPAKSQISILQAIFNRNTVKVSYSCTQNMSSMIKSHNKKVINRDAKKLKSCNCRVKSECPLNGQCQVTDIIYKCIVLSPDKPNKV